MTVIEWDAPGERTYQTGVDRGVLYLKDGTSVPWNGITGVDEGNNSELKSYYMDGIKFLETVTPGEYVGKLTAFTYPEEFDQVMGIVPAGHGISLYEQPPQRFNLSYRTKIGNDLDGVDHGYKIHLLYNLLAVPDSNAFGTLAEVVNPVEFSWSLTGTPPLVAGYRPTVHVSVDSTDIGAILLQQMEDILYGTDTEDPRFPPIDEVVESFGSYDDLIITDNGDGTWTAEDYDGDYISMIDSTTFQIENADAEYSDPDTYDISSTNVD